MPNNPLNCVIPQVSLPPPIHNSPSSAILSDGTTPIGDTIYPSGTVVLLTKSGEVIAEIPKSEWVHSTNTLYPLLTPNLKFNHFTGGGIDRTSFPSNSIRGASYSGACRVDGWVPFSTGSMGGGSAQYIDMVFYHLDPSTVTNGSRIEVSGEFWHQASGNLHQNFTAVFEFGSGGTVASCQSAFLNGGKGVPDVRMGLYNSKVHLYIHALAGLATGFLFFRINMKSTHAEMSSYLENYAPSYSFSGSSAPAGWSSAVPAVFSNKFKDIVSGGVIYSETGQTTIQAAVSDARTKRNIAPIPIELAKQVVNYVTVATYTFNGIGGTHDGIHGSGVIASEEAYQLFPDFFEPSGTTVYLNQSGEEIPPLQIPNPEYDQEGNPIYPDMDAILAAWEQDRDSNYTETPLFRPKMDMINAAFMTVIKQLALTL